MAILVGVWCVGFILFYVSIHQPKPPTPSAPNKTTGIAVLTGGTGRLEAGLSLLENGTGVRLLISGVHTSVSANDLVNISGAKPNLFDCCVDLDRASANTIENALMSAAWVKEKQYTSLYLVTSGYHIPRSLLLFEAAMPDVKIMPVAVDTPMSYFAIILEYNKYLVTAVRLLF